MGAARLAVTIFLLPDTQGGEQAAMAFAHALRTGTLANGAIFHD